MFIKNPNLNNQIIQATRLFKPSDLHICFDYINLSDYNIQPIINLVNIHIQFVYKSEEHPNSTNHSQPKNIQP